MSTQPAPLSMADFPAWEARQEARHECVDGRIVAFAGATLRHSAIVLNLGAALPAALRDRPCRVLGSGAMAVVRATRLIRPSTFIDRRAGIARTQRRYSTLVSRLRSPSAKRDGRRARTSSVRASPSRIISARS
jgi:Uma2 family endonuclease